MKQETSERILAELRNNIFILDANVGESNGNYYVSVKCSDGEELISFDEETIRILIKRLKTRNDLAWALIELIGPNRWYDLQTLTGLPDDVCQKIMRIARDAFEVKPRYPFD